MSHHRQLDSPSTKSVVIIGGGLAGISAAITLREQGYRVTLLESRRRLGGRAGSFEDSLSGQTLDYCQHVGMACCTSLVWLLKKLAIEDDWDREKVLHFYSSSGKHLPIQGSLLPAPLHLSSLLCKWPELTYADRLSIAWGLWKLMRLPLAGELDSILAIDWLRSIGQSESAIQRFWGTILVSALGEQIERVSLNASRKVLIDGFAANRHGYHLLVPHRPLSELIGKRGLAELQRFGIDVQCGVTIDACHWENRECRAVISTSGVRFEADHFLFALPWHRIERLLEEYCDCQVIANLQSAPITGVHTWWDRAWLDQPHAILVDRLCQWVFRDPLHMQHNELMRKEKEASFYYQIVISGSRDLPRGDSSTILEAVKKDLSDIFPIASESKLLRGRVVTDPNAVFSVTPGHQAARLACDHFSQQNIWLAGDWTKTDWPATMEGAIRSGILATTSICLHDQHPIPNLPSNLKQGRLARWLIT